MKSSLLFDDQLVEGLGVESKTDKFLRTLLAQTKWKNLQRTGRRGCAGYFSSSQLFLVLHATVLEPSFDLKGENFRENLNKICFH